MALRRLLGARLGRRGTPPVTGWVGSDSRPPAGPTPMTVVVVHRNLPGSCARTVFALRASTVRPLRVIVVDNDSPTSARRLLAAGLGASAEMIENGANLGFGPAANVGLRRFLAGDPAVYGDWVAVCPHDAEPVNPATGDGALDRLVAAAEARGPRAGLACAELGLDTVPVVDPYFGGMTMPAHRHGEWAPAGYPHGTLMIARRECLADIGLFDESFFAYCEEADLGLRARQAGWLVGQVWGAQVRNTGMSDDVGSEYLQIRNTLELVHRWSGRYKVGIRLALAGAEVVRRRQAGEPWEHQAQAITDWVQGRRTGPPPAELRRPAA